MNARLSILAILLALLFISCDDNNSESYKGQEYPIIIKTTELTVEKNKITTEDITLPYNYKIHIIRSGEELASYIKNSELEWNIDFSKNSLLIVSGVFAYGISDITAQLEQTTIKDYSFNVLISTNEASVISPWTVAVIASKIPTNIEITGKVIYDGQDDNSGETLSLYDDQQSISYPLDIKIKELSIEENNITANYFKGTSNQLQIINSNEELKQHLIDNSTSTFWNIDFSKYTLFLIDGGAQVQTDVYKASLIETEMGKFKFNINVFLQIWQATSYWIKGYLVPKMTDEPKITGRVEYYDYSGLKNYNIIGEEEFLEIIHLSELSIENNNIISENITIDERNKLHIINSDEELLKFIPKTTSPFWNIDFSNKSLLLLKYTDLSNDFEFKLISDNRYIFTNCYTINNDPIVVNDKVYAALVPKIKADAEVESRRKICIFSTAHCSYYLF